ncbi:YbaY family lipoprotein [Streptomyces albipurpureus]|uniref:YbaY family lipoprotein n=1 Tax=Streptomyces albipurpureus TaxID=2897419 RepID=A0ABT0V145_9ACTN|nr:YbaY family lipoprotein [Streptomyces sp. CWNU-1]MCM2394221.1 YbaY family lipoprotein [Streptomyces sp. CWNU-1]
MPTVEITVKLAPGITAPGAEVTLRAQVEEVSAVDAPARVVAREVLHGVRLERPQRLLLEAPPPDPRARYTVRVHADSDGSGLVATDDLVTTRAYPVLTDGHPNRVVVELSAAS